MYPLDLGALVKETAHSIYTEHLSSDLSRVQNRNFEAVANLGECPLGGTGPGHLALVRIFIYNDNMYWFNKSYLFRGKYTLFIHVCYILN